MTIDQASASALERKISQWPRSWLAGVVRALAADGAELVVLDLDLSQPGAAEPGEDEALAAAIEEANDVVLAHFTSGGRQVLPLASFRRGAVGEGAIDHLPDADGLLRGIPLVAVRVDEEERLAPSFSLALETARLLLDPEGKRQLDLSSPDLLRLGDLAIPNPGGRMALDFSGPAGSYRRVPFAEVLRGAVPAGTFTGKTVLVGNTHPAFHDFFLTPLASSPLPLPRLAAAMEVSREGMSGVEVHAHALQAILDRAFIRVPPRGATLLLVLLAGLAATLLFIAPGMRPVPSLLAFLSLTGLVLLAAFLLFRHLLLMVPVAAVETPLVLCYLGGVGWQRIVALREKAQVTRTFGRYVSFQVVDRLLREPELVRLGGEKRVLTVLFSDMRGFTAAAEAMDPQQAVRFLNGYHTAMTRVVFEQGGVLDKYMGDGLMAFFGAPVEAPDHAARACRTALGMAAALRPLQREWREQGLPVIDIGVGINTGPMVVGNMGSELRFDYTVIGDSVNLAARLEPLNKRYRTTILAGPGTRAAAGDRFCFRELERVRVKGKEEALVLHQLLEEDPASPPPYLAVWQRALERFRAGEHEAAGRALEEVLALRPDDGPSRFFLERLASGARPDGEGVWPAVEP